MDRATKFSVKKKGQARPPRIGPLSRSACNNGRYTIHYTLYIPSLTSSARGPDVRSGVGARCSYSFRFIFVSLWQLKALVSRLFPQAAIREHLTINLGVCPGDLYSPSRPSSLGSYEEDRQEVRCNGIIVPEPPFAAAMLRSFRSARLCFRGFDT